MEEKTFLGEVDVTVTNARFIAKSHTFAIREDTVIERHHEDQSRRKAPSSWE